MMMDGVARRAAVLRDHEAAHDTARDNEAAEASEAMPAKAPDFAASPVPAETLAAHSREELFAELSGMYATALEYPVEVFTEDMELEADLGVDSVKQTELLSHAADRYQLPARPTDFRLSDYSTMGKVVHFVFGALTAPARIVRHRFHTRFWFDHGAARPATSEIEEKL